MIQNRDVKNIFWKITFNTILIKTMNKLIFNYKQNIFGKLNFCDINLKLNLLQKFIFNKILL